MPTSLAVVALRRRGVRPESNGALPTCGHVQSTSGIPKSLWPIQRELSPFGGDLSSALSLRAIRSGAADRHGRRAGFPEGRPGGACFWVGSELVDSATKPIADVEEITACLPSTVVPKKPTDATVLARMPDGGVAAATSHAAVIKRQARRMARLHWKNWPTRYRVRLPESLRSLYGGLPGHWSLHGTSQSPTPYPDRGVADDAGDGRRN